MLEPTKRFSNRAENYLKYRPSYPREILPFLESECGLTVNAIVADLGSGTGLLAELFLKNGNRVFGVEPNAAMRAAGEKFLTAYPNFVSVEGAAEATTLPDESIDFIVAGQAFHWFDRERARPEFRRILKANGWVVLIWNGFRTDTSLSTRAFQDLTVKFSTDSHEAVREVLDDDIKSFFAPCECRKKSFSNRQILDFEGLKGRLLSMSYAPDRGDASFQPMLADLRSLFDRYAASGKFHIDYETPVYIARPTCEAAP